MRTVQIHSWPLQYELWWSNKDDPNNGINRGEAMNPEQPFVLSNGDPTGYVTWELQITILILITLSWLSHQLRDPW